MSMENNIENQEKFFIGSKWVTENDHEAIVINHKRKTDFENDLCVMGDEEIKYTSLDEEEAFLVMHYDNDKFVKKLWHRIDGTIEKNGYNLMSQIGESTWTHYKKK